MQNNCVLLQTFPELWNYYVANHGTNNISQHNQLALSYRDVIAQSLQEYQPGLSQQYYNDLAWDGLEETFPFTNDDPLTRLLDANDRFRIGKIGDAESKNTPQFNQMGTITYYPKGVPCP